MSISFDFIFLGSIINMVEKKYKKNYINISYHNFTTKYMKGFDIYAK